MVPVVALVTVLVTLNVTDDSSSSASSGSRAGHGRSGTAISIKNFQYSPNPITVKAGAAVTVTNDDGTVHTLTADKGQFDTGDLDGGARGTITIDAAGQVRLPLHDPQLHDRHHRGDMTTTGVTLERSHDEALSGGIVAAAIVGATALLVSGWVHFYLYFRGGYRGIALDSVLGLNISRSFALNAIAAVVIAEAVILGLRYRALLLPAAAVGVGFAVATLVAYFLSRTRGLLGFKETATTTEAVIAMVSEGVIVLTLVPVAITELRARRRRAR